MTKANMIFIPNRKSVVVGQIGRNNFCGVVYHFIDFTQVVIQFFWESNFAVNFSFFSCTTYILCTMRMSHLHSGVGNLAFEHPMDRVAPLLTVHGWDGFANFLNIATIILKNDAASRKITTLKRKLPTKLFVCEYCFK